ncbi:hypothetical protein SAMN05444344_0700 [Tenacibaculum mesophilum]|uniref:DUF4034 domain-containing protein n=1 Tax=Tenacibaculum mesophilum TaxID=104268 RepID=A0ABM7CI94_9FLAO|nr:hypothetical protein [Tenacibaculum mesophilum]AZJ33502.1 hypothetical protein D6200_13375 [Tenacibaculum mesophilum]QFS28742.1 hypothetical protein F9Y86_10185 [Tenacibaculum mesophilum]SHF59575.1 hypothetical protein SAMN05444344_0700 [Tenacibaculum mesophilum]
MIDFFNQYPIVKWILIGLGILYFLDKYGIFSPVDNLINLIGRYKFKSHAHLNDLKLKEVIIFFNKRQFSNVEQTLKSMNSSQRSFAFESLGQYGNIKISDEWITKDNNNDLPKIIKGYQLIHKAWQIRGRGTIDSVSNEKLASFKKHLKKAEAILIEVNNKNSSFKTNIISCLLDVYKAINANRQYVHQLFENVINEFPDDAELHKNYLAFVSPKWGASVEEYENYLNRMNEWAPFIQQLILAQYYFDLIYFHNYQDDEGKIEQLMTEVRTAPIENINLHRYELYKLLYWAASNLGLIEHETYYKEKALPYLED